MNAIDRRLRAVSVLAGALLAAIIGSAHPSANATTPFQAPIDAAQQQADQKAVAAYERVCSTCHDSQRILSNRRTKDQWSEVIDKMVERGAQGTDDDFTAVMEYLITHYGRINVNKAPAKDLAKVVRISDKDAETIVAFRKENGPFKDLDTLCTVPGIDVAALKQNLDAISF
jgi:competence protein ComEA